MQGASECKTGRGGAERWCIACVISHWGSQVPVPSIPAARLPSALPSYLDKIRVSVLLSYVNLLIIFKNTHYEALLSILGSLCLLLVFVFLKPF